jgi:hypothetical protein
MEYLSGTNALKGEMSRLDALNLSSTEEIESFSNGSMDIFPSIWIPPCSLPIDKERISIVLAE